MIELILAIIILGLLGLLGYSMRRQEHERLELSSVRRQLRESRSFVDRVLSDSPICVVICDANGEIKDWSPSFLELYQVSKSELAEKTLWDFVDLDYVSSAKDLLQGVIRGGSKKREVILTRNSLVEQIWSQVDIAPMDKLFIVALVNVSSSVKNGELIERFQHGLDQVQIMALTDIRGIITYANESFCRVSGYTADEIVGKSHSLISSGTHSPEFYEKMWTTIISGKTWKGQIRNRAKDGIYFWLETTILPFTNDRGAPVQFVSVSLDITAKKEAEIQLQNTMKTIEFENKIWRVIDRVQTNLSVLKAESDMLAILLQIVCEDLGWAYAQIYERTSAENEEYIVHQQSFAMNPYLWDKLISGAGAKKLRPGEDLPGMTWEKNAPVWIEDLAGQNVLTRTFDQKVLNLTSGLCVPLLVNGDLYGVIEMLSTDHRRQDPMVIRAMVVISAYFGKVLERQIQERKDAEYRDQLALSAKMSTLGEMASGIAHEINNPLAIIRGYAQTVKKTIETDESIDKQKVLRTLDRIVSTSDRIGKIVKGLRSFARDGSADVFVETTIKSIIDDSLSICEVKLKEADVELRIEPFDEKLTVECRSVQISQIVINLINNGVDAIEAMEKKWVQIKIEDLGEYVEIVVVDAGGGIPDSLLQKIMQPFFTTKAIGKGTGLGLSIARGIAESHSGVFGVHADRPNTTFYLRLPKKQVQSSGQPIERAS